MLRDELLLDIDLAFKDDEILLDCGPAELAIHQLKYCLELIPKLLQMKVGAKKL